MFDVELTRNAMFLFVLNKYKSDQYCFNEWKNELIESIFLNINLPVQYDEWDLFTDRDTRTGYSVVI